MQNWWKVMAAYRRVYDSCHLQADCQEPGSASEPYARQSNMDYQYLFYWLPNVLVHSSLLGCIVSPVLALRRILKKLHVTNRYTRNAFTTYRPTDMFDSEITEFTDSQATSRLQDDIGDVQGALVYGQLADESTRRQHSQVADNYVDL